MKLILCLPKSLTIYHDWCKVTYAIFNIDISPIYSVFRISICIIKKIIIYIDILEIDFAQDVYYGNNGYFKAKISGKAITDLVEVTF